MTETEFRVLLRQFSEEHHECTRLTSQLFYGTWEPNKPTFYSGWRSKKQSRKSTLENRVTALELGGRLEGIDKMRESLVEAFNSNNTQEGE